METRVQPEHLTQPEFVPLVDKVGGESAVSDLAQRNLSCSSVTGGACKIRVETVTKQVECTTEAEGVQCQEPGSSQQPTPPNAGQLSDEWFTMKMMHALRDIDGKHSLHLHLDEKTLELIAEGKYVEFGKLLKSVDDNEEPMCEVKQNDLTFYIPTQKQPRKVDCLATWCKAFMVFHSTCQVYRPEISGQLLEYRSSIKGFARHNEWSSVYAYDRFFCCVQASRPGRPWNLTNQAAKDEFLQGGPDKVKQINPIPGGGKPEVKGDKKKRRDLCRQFNAKNACRFGETCKFNHRCAICGKPGYGVVVCMKQCAAEKTEKNHLKKEPQ